MRNVKVLYVPREQKQDYGLGSIFLAGPTPRSKDVKSWRPEFIDVLDKKRVKCSVFVPETSKGDWLGNFEKQCNWEYEHLHKASVIVFWVPRELETMPAFTTNVEFGFWMAKAPGRVFYGRPDNTPKTKYLDWLYAKQTSGMSPVSNIEDLAHNVVGFLTA